MADGEYSAKFTGGGNLGDVVKNLAAQLANLKAQIDAVNKASIAPKPAAQKRGANKHKPETAKDAVQAEKQKVEALKKTLAARKEAEKQRNLEHQAEKKRLKEKADAALNDKGRKANEAKKREDKREEDKKKREEDKKTKETERKAEKKKKEDEKARKEKKREDDKKKKADEKANKDKERKDAKQKKADEKAEKDGKKPAETFKKENAELVRAQNAKAESDAATARAKQMDELKKDILDRHKAKEDAGKQEQKQTEKFHTADTKANDKKRKHDAKARAQVRAEESKGRQQGLAQQRAEAMSVFNQVNSGANRVLSRRGQSENTLQELNQRRGQALRGGDLRGYRAATIEANKLKRSMADVNGLTGILRNSMIRLGTTLAATFGVFQAVRGFTEFVKSGLAFNDTLAKSEIGVAGLITALGQIRNEQGDLVTGAEAFGAAMGFAREQVEGLRQDSLRTTASFGELLSTFQVSVGPGLAAGLNLDQIREITVGISQAAAAISLPQNQLAEEVRSLLSGTIQLRTTRIAAVLGITNADVKRWKEIGSLSEEINSRLAAFNKASEEAARATLGGVGARLADALSQAAGKASEGLFKTLLDAGNNLFDNVVTIRDELGQLQPNPKFIASFQTLFNAVDKIAKGVIAFVSDLEKLQKIGAFIGTSVTVVFETLAVVVSTLVSVMGALSEAFSNIAKWTGITAGGFGRFLGVLLTVVATFKVLHAIFLSFIKLRFAASISHPFVLALTAILGIVVAVKALKSERTKAEEAVKNENAGLREQLEIQKKITDNEKLAREAKQDALLLGDVEKRLTKFAQLEADSEAPRSVSGRQSSDAVVEGRRSRARKELESLKEQNALDKELIKFLQERANQRAGTSEFAESGSGFFLSATKRALQPFEEDIDKEERKAANLSKAGAASTGGLSEDFEASLKAELAAAEDLNEVYVLRENLMKQRRAAYAAQSKLAEDATAAERGEAAKNIAGIKADIDETNAVIDRFKAAARLSETARQAAAAADANPARAEENRALETKLRTERGLEDGDLDERSLAILRTQAELIQAQETARARNLQITQEINLAVGNTEQRLRSANENEKKALTEQLELKRQSLALEKFQLAEAERIAALRLKEARLQKEGTFAQGMDEGRNQLINELPTRFEAGVNIMKGTVTSFASFASQMITDAFDPNQDATLSERFGQFFMQIGQMWLEEMIKVRIQAALAEKAAKAVKTAGDTASAAATAGAGAAAGGAGGWLSLFSMFASGFNEGGAVRGKGGGKDTIPAMLGDGEYVLNAKATKALGLSALDAFNSGDSLGGLSALTGGAMGQTVDPKTGGSAGGSKSAAGASGGGSVVLPVLVSNERSVDQMLRGGKGALGNRVREARGRRIRD